MPFDLVPAKEVSKEGNIILYLGGLVSMPLLKTKGTLRIDAQKFVKQVLGKSFWIEA